MKLSPKISQKLQMKTIMVYAGVGIAFTTIITALVFIYLNTGNSENAMAATTFKTNAGGPWTTAGTWQGTAPTTQIGNKDEVIINSGHEVFVQDLYFDQNTTLTIFGTLVVKGNFTMEQLANFTVAPGGVFIVMGNYNAQHHQTFANNGTIALMGDVVTDHSSTYQNNGLLYTDAGLPLTGESAPAQPESAIQDNSNLMTLLSNHGYNTSTLPVTLLSFTVANETDGGVLVKWSTANEQDNDFFTIERSKDGKVFEIIGTEDGSGTSMNQLDYSFYDASPINGKAYYRLKQTDYNGEFEYFGAVALERTPVEEEFNLVSVGPNPFTDYFTVNFSSPSDGITELHLINAKGEVVVNEKIHTDKGQNSFEFNEGYKLKKEIFFLRLIQNGKSTKSVRLIKK